MWQKVGRANEAPRHTGGTFPTGAPPPKYVLMGMSAGGDRGGVRHDGSEFPRLHILVSR